MISALLADKLSKSVTTAEHAARGCIVVSMSSSKTRTEAHNIASFRSTIL